MLRHTKLLLGLVFALAAPSAALAPQLAMADTTPVTNWVQGSATGPSGRESAYMAYDSSRNRTVLFGGVQEGTSTNSFFSDTWEYDGTTWSQIPVSGPPPPGALGQMVFDSARGVSVLFGGGDATTFLAPITWEWNGSTWTPRFTTTRPPARVWFGMTYDSTRHVVVLFGGDGRDAGGGHILLSDTWEYDGNDWRQVLTAHSPSGRYGHALAYDSGRGKTVLFAGHDDTAGRLNDTWEYNGTDWTQVAIASPPATRFWHSMAYVPALGKVIVFGGDYFVPSVTLGPNNETWLYDGSSWQRLTTANSPSPRIMAPVAYDAAHSSLVLFGGSTEITPVQSLADTWALVVPQSAATLSATSMQFPMEPVLSVTARDVTLTNTGSAPLAVSSIAAGGDFATADNCPRSPGTVAPSAFCTITVKFTPSSGDLPSSGTLTVTDNAPGGAQSIPLGGSGAWGELHASSEPLAFGASPINPSGVTASVQETITFPAAPTIVTGFTADIPFFVNNLDCPIGAQVGGGATCHVQVGFGPTTAGTYSGQVVIHDNEPGLRHPIAMSGTANPIPVAITLNVTSNDVSPTFGHTLNVQATANSPFGTATFSLNGHQAGAPVDLNGTGTASAVIPLNDTTIPAGAGTYPIAVTVRPNDGVHSDGSISQLVTVVQATEQMSWTGTGLAVAGTSVVLAAKVAPPSGETRFYDFADHPVWVRFDVTHASGVVRTYYAQVFDVNTPSGFFGEGTATVKVTGLAPGAFTVRARLVSASGSSASNAYVTSKDLRSAFAVFPARGGYIAGSGRQGAMTIGFEFTDAQAGSLAWVDLVRVTGSDGLQHEAYQIITSTSVTSIDSHAHTVTVTGTAKVIFFDPTTGTQYTGLDRKTPFRLTVAGDGSIVVAVNGANVSLPPGSAINHL